MTYVIYKLGTLMTLGANFMKPNFMIIGAARSGTTSLYLYLEQHPEIYFSDVKELNFFSNEKYWKKGLKWYESRFKPKKRNISCIGEASTSYTRAPLTQNTARRIYEYNPNMKLIYLVRDPIDRLISHYLHRIQAGQEIRDFNEIIENIKNETFAWQGLYHYQLQQYTHYFDREQIFVCSMDQLKSDPEFVIKNIFRFLGLNSELDIGKTGRVFNANKNTTRKSKTGIFFMDLYRGHLQQRSLPYQAKKMVKKLGEIGAKNITPPKLGHEEYCKLVSFYRQDSINLGEEFGVKVDNWFSKNIEQ